MQGCLALEPSKLHCTGDDERGVYRVVPLAIHFAGRSGNFAACLQFLRSLAAPSTRTSATASASAGPSDLWD